MMKDLKHLIKLSLFKSGLDDNSVVKFKELQLKELHLIECNKLTDTGLIKLSQVRGLKRLILEDLKSITPKGILSLRKLSPHLKVQVTTTKSDFEF